MSHHSYRTALIIGRFQPFHHGHLYLLQRAAAVADEVVVAIGSASTHDEKNPLSYEVRRRMLEEVIRRENLKQVVRIVPSFDVPSDAQWLEDLEKAVGKFDVTLGNNDWTNQVLGDAGYAVIKVVEHQRELFEGTAIRRLHRENGEWRDRTLSYLVEWIDAELRSTMDAC
jgi:nicotinamide-nucleotide adenylyltransferase